VSHDIPFEDGESGVIDIKITAKSPIFIRDHEKQEEFCQHNGEYYIPSSSVKGMTRSVLEIMSFGKIPIDNKIHTKTMSIRDMTNRKEMVGTANGCGFLKQNSKNEWYIEDYGKPRTIGYVSKYDKTIKNSTINCDFETAEEKYKENTLYQRIPVRSSIKDLYNRDNKKIGTKRVAELLGTVENAYLVFTGGIDNKKNEFVFVDNDKESDSLLKDKVVEKFKKVYFESDSVDGNFWRRNYDATIGIPIFYIKDKNQNITDIGLSQLFKLAYTHTINDATKQNEEFIYLDNDKKDIKLDLAQTIFGAIRDESTSLKGRVQFSHFKLDGKAEFFDTKIVVLGSPNASFYPEYIEQNCNKQGKLQGDKYKTLMDTTAKISGWKRYPLHFNKLNIKSVEASDSSTTFTALGNYINNDFNEFSFNGKLRFHNLTKVELGALISALTFHNNHDTFYHNIGMAKALGFGKIKIKVNTENYKEALQAYEYFMNNWTEEKLNKSWLQTEQIKELFTMAYKGLNIDKNLKYLVLDPENKINKFVDAKKEKDCLPKCSELFNIGDNYPKSLIDDEVLNIYKEEKKKKEKEKIFQKELNFILNSDNPQTLQNFIEKYPDYEKINEIKSKKEKIEKAKKDDRHKDVNEKFDRAYEALQKKKGNQKQYLKEKDKFVKKWNKEKEHKGSSYILEIIQNL
jgi:CRISPR-associated protein (TIGR03986 family)